MRLSPLASSWIRNGHNGPDPTDGVEWIYGWRRERMSQASCIAARAVQGRVWHRIKRRNDPLTWTGCSSSFYTSRCDTTVLAGVPNNKRCARCWGAYTAFDTD